MPKKTFNFATKVIKAGVEPDSGTGAIMTPIFQTSTYIQQSPGKHKGYEYSRSQNPTREALEHSLASLENGTHGFCFGSGMAAIDCVMRLLKPGDHVISSNDLYGGSYRIFDKVYKDWGIEFDFIDLNDEELIKKTVRKNTRMIWIETPTNPLLKIVDLEKVIGLAKENNILACVDNTFATPYLQTPIDLGADIVIHSVTKYLGGHSDVVLGAVVVNDDVLAERLRFYQNACGAIAGPMDCFLSLRGIKTLHLRMERHCLNAAKIADFLNGDTRVEKVIYPGLPSHAQHELASRQMRLPGGMVSFEAKGGKEQAIAILERFRIFSLAESLGGVESLCGHPATMTHASIPSNERIKAGLNDSLIRLSVGIEDTYDLINDLDFALDI